VAVAVAAVAWVGLLAAAPWITSHASTRSVAFRAAVIVYLAGGTVCHQQDERSFHLWGTPLPVCGRCTGLYAGAAAGSLCGVAWLGRRRRRLGLPTWRTLLAAAVAPSVASVGLELAGVWAQSPLVRSVAALPAGFVVAWFVASHASDVTERLQT
jgi:uncharacterized membrane protein